MQEIFNMIGGYFVNGQGKSKKPEDSTDIKILNIIRTNSGCSPGSEADEKTPERKPTVLNTNTSGNKPVLRLSSIVTPVTN